MSYNFLKLWNGKPISRTKPTKTKHIYRYWIELSMKLCMHNVPQIRLIFNWVLKYLILPACIYLFGNTSLIVLNQYYQWCIPVPEISTTDFRVVDLESLSSSAYTQRFSNDQIFFGKICCINAIIVLQLFNYKV